MKEQYETENFELKNMVSPSLKQPVSALPIPLPRTADRYESVFALLGVFSWLSLELRIPLQCPRYRETPMKLTPL